VLTLTLHTPTSLDTPEWGEILLNQNSSIFVFEGAEQTRFRALTSSRDQVSAGLLTPLS
jgi:hypothetical protein